MARKKSKYRLQIVLDRKEEARQEAAVILAEKKEALKREQEEEARLNGELAKNRERRIQEYERMASEGLSGALDANSAQQRLNFVKHLDHLAKLLQEQIAAQKKKVEKAQNEVEEAMQNLVIACQELKVMEKHKEKWQRKVKREEDLAEQNEMNEIGNMMYVANRSKSF